MTSIFTIQVNSINLNFKIPWIKKTGDLAVRLWQNHSENNRDDILKSLWVILINI